MIPRILFCLAVLSLCGCATLAARQTCVITSNPPGAHVYVVGSPDAPTAGKPLGTTPMRRWFQQGVTTEYLRAELAGYQPVTWPLPDSLRFAHHFDLVPSVSVQVSRELATYPREYVRSVLEVLGKCDEALASPHLLIGPAAAAANSANERLRFDHPEREGSALAVALDGTLDELLQYGELASGGNDLAAEARARNRAQELLGEIKQALDVR